MAANPIRGDKPGVSDIVDSTDKDRLIKELRERISVLENKLRLKQNNAISTDTAECKPAEDALCESEELQRAIFENAGTGIVLCSAAGVFLKVNKRFSDLIGYSQTEIVGMNFRDITGDGSPLEQKLIDEAQAGLRSGYSIEKQYLTKDGRLIWVNVTSSVLRDTRGRVTGAIGIIEEISERKRTEGELRETRDYLESLINYANAPIIVWDHEFVITQFNHAFERLSGYAAVEVVGQSLKRLFPPESVDESLAKIRDTLSGQRWESVEIPILRKDGCTRIALWNSANIQDEMGKLQATIAQGQDITDRKQAEKELNEAKAQAELYLDLMSHDINNMNQSALGFLELALQTLDIKGRIEVDGKVLIEKPLQAVQGSSRLISNVRKLQRLADEGMKTRPIDLYDLFQALESLDFHVGNRNSNIKIFGVPHGLVDSNDLLIDVFFNLISNAVKHSSPDRPVTVNVRAERIEQGNQAYYRCTVEDDGPGIADDLKPMLFHRFQRGKTQAHGKGLGLYLVRMLVEGYHGKVWVEDRVSGDYSKGSRFIVMLPAVEG